MKQFDLVFMYFLTLFLFGCTSESIPPISTNSIPYSTSPTSSSTLALPTQTITALKTTASPIHTILPTKTLSPTPIPSSTPRPYGPDNFPENINPLNGLSVSEPENLQIYSPALVSIPNFPVTARPQNGLSFASVIFEMYIGEGASRFLAVFYGDYPFQGKNPSSSEHTEVGPIRSGRLPYQSLCKFYNGFMVIAGASTRVLPHLDDFSIVSNPNPGDINGAKISVSELKNIALDTRNRKGAPSLTGNIFSPIPPLNGKNGNKIWVAYHFSNQIFWQYDTELQSYLRYQDRGEKTQLEVFRDGLNSDPLTFENLVILYTNYHRFDETLFDIEFMYIQRYPALLFRDGRMYEIFWTTRSEDYEKRTGKLRPIRFVDYSGNPFPLKPGQTWVEILHLNNPYFETVDSEDYSSLMTSRQPGSGIWAAPFISPSFENPPANN